MHIRAKKLIICLLLAAIVLAPTARVSAESESYTYSYEYFDFQLESPDAYTPTALLLGSALGIGDFSNPKSLFVRDEYLYIVDSGNNRIVVVDRYFELIRIIDKVMDNAEELTFRNPSDVYVDTEGGLYICDTDNNRVLHTDKDLNLIKTYVKPEDPTILGETNFIPLKCVADKAGRLFVLAGNVNQGFMEFDRDGQFTNFIGANPVKATFWDAIKKRLMTKEQRDRMILFVPTEYSNLAIDKDDFLYATTNTFTTNQLVTMETVNPVRKLNSIGDDILVRNGYEPPIGDLQWGTGGDISGPSRFEDVTPMDNDTYFCLDRNRGRIFGYDFQGNMLYAFGGIGNKLGYFQYPVSIEHMGTDLLVLDNRYSSVTRFTLTEFGSYINEGLALYKEGKYEESAEYWKKALRLNGNYDLAYIGIGRALLREGEYKEAMKYFESKRDYINYSKAFSEYRQEWVEEHISYLLLGAVVLIITPLIISRIRKRFKGGAAKHERKS
jgi:tetratricopeptide (TPR) repeat protein